MALSRMFDTFMWILGEEPFLSFNQKIKEMDAIGRSCMKYDSVIYPKRSSVNVKVMTSEGQHELKMKSTEYITVEDFVEIINSKMSEVLDVQNNDIIVSKIFIQSSDIVLFTHVGNLEI